MNMYNGKERKQMTDTEIKLKIEELEKQSIKIAEEIYRLKESNKGYWIGIGDNDYLTEYHRLGWCTESEAEKMMEEKDEFVFGFRLKEVTKEYNTKMYKAEKMQTIVGLLDDEDFAEYKETRDAIKKELEELKEELDMCPCSSIY